LQQHNVFTLDQCYDIISSFKRKTQKSLMVAIVSLLLMLLNILRYKLPESAHFVRLVKEQGLLGQSMLIMGP